MYNIKSLDDAIVSIMPNFNGNIKGNMRYRLCFDAAALCWIKNVEETPHTLIIREAINDLMGQGYFNFSD